MKRNQYIAFIGSLFWVASMTSCVAESGINEENRCEPSDNFVAYTRNDDTQERTYKVYGFSYSGGTYGVGTYKTIPGQPMTPCKLNEDGSINEEATSDDHAGSRVDYTSGAYWLCISPGVADDYNNFEIKPSDNNILMSNVSPYTTTPDFKLYERRARINFNVSIGGNNTTVDEIELEDIVIKGVGDPDTPVIYKPHLNQVDNANLATSVKMVDASPADRPKSKYTSLEPLYVISAYYATKDKVKSLGYIIPSEDKYFDSQYISAELNLKIGDKGEISISQLLTLLVIELKPMHEYTYNFTINTEYVNLNLVVNAWTQENNSDGEQHIGDLGDTFTIDLGKWKLGDDGGWTPAVSEDQII